MKNYTEEYGQKVTLVWGPVLTINFCLNKLLIGCLLIVSNVVVKFRYTQKNTQLWTVVPHRNMLSLLKYIMYDELN